MAEPFTPEEVEAICRELKSKDIKYARSLDSFQESFLSRKPRIKNWQEFKTVEEMKRTMISLHEPVGDVSVKVDGIEVTFVRPNKG